MTLVPITFAQSISADQTEDGRYVALSMARYWRDKGYAVTTAETTVSIGVTATKALLIKREDGKMVGVDEST